MLASAGFRATGVRPLRAGRFCAVATIIAHCRWRGSTDGDGAERDREFIADLDPKALGLGKADVMGVARRSPAGETGLLRHETQMLLASIRFGSLMVSTLLSIFAPAPLWVCWSDMVSASLLRFSGLTRATAPRRRA